MEMECWSRNYTVTELFLCLNIFIFFQKNCCVSDSTSVARVFMIFSSNNFDGENIPSISCESFPKAHWSHFSTSFEFSCACASKAPRFFQNFMTPESAYLWATQLPPHQQLSSVKQFYQSVCMNINEQFNESKEQYLVLYHPQFTILLWNPGNKEKT